MLLFKLGGGIELVRDDFLRDFADDGGAANSFGAVIGPDGDQEQWAEAGHWDISLLAVFGRAPLLRQLNSRRMSFQRPQIAGATMTSQGKA